jgi:hypothetical protein
MKRYLLLALLICGCVQTEQQSRAHHAAEQYIKDFLNPKGLETIAFSSLEKKRYVTPLDSSLNYAHISPDDHKKMEKYVDSENGQRPDRAPGNIRQMDSIEKGKLFYYSLTYSFRVDSGTKKKVLRYRFELDTAFNVVNAKDITDDHSTYNN